MGSSAATVNRLQRLRAHAAGVAELLQKYRVSNPRIFGSVARGDATESSDIDLLVDLEAGGGNDLMRVAGLATELSELLGVPVDVAAPGLLRAGVSVSAEQDLARL